MNDHRGPSDTCDPHIPQQPIHDLESVHTPLKVEYGRGVSVVEEAVAHAAKSARSADEGGDKVLVVVKIAYGEVGRARRREERGGDAPGQNLPWSGDHGRADIEGVRCCPVSVVHRRVKEKRCCPLHHFMNLFWKWFSEDNASADPPRRCVRDALQASDAVFVPMKEP
eukprot:CAMPEP_0175839988 /NCGR_PEP_ID=MMETSP0107_2-20121207/19113_1 /TAXON_ID=195067 ORGANISM="Goniomonas pacifica, Strain CCMP1869" /NCGR_SAMPLE_ID=MMETSP0107_2 /ASSEMBLY_ACC=CAM_ASM_000203 /LENGTH=167 /DNA_ID=CAMNT_0017153773 /DNA_START=277 /DNA_END=780 /DNA_ORIENTATION=-